MTTKAQKVSPPTIVLAGMLYFITAACYHLDLPGVYYDEVLFAPVTLKAIGYRHIQAAVSKSIGSFPVLMSPPYLGALKAYIHAPIFWLFGVSALTIRLPMLIVSGLMLLPMFQFIKRRLGGLFASAAFLLMATDPAYIFHSRVDWGPFVLSNLFKLLSLGFCLKWLESKRVVYLFVTLLALFCGFYDKFNFIWMIVALSPALLFVYPKQITACFHHNRILVSSLLLGFALVFCGMIWKLVLPVLALNGGDEAFKIVAQVIKIKRLYEITFSGEGQFYMMFKRPLGIIEWISLLILPQLVFGTSLSIAWIFRRNESVSIPIRYLVFVNTIFIILMAQMIATKAVGGTHHLVFLWPLHYLHLVLCGAIIIQWFEKTRRTPWVKMFLRIAATFCITAIVIQHVRVTGLYIDALQPDGRFSPSFDPVIYDLIDHLQDDPADAIFSVDWGIHQTAVSMAASPQRQKYLDQWPFFNEPPGRDERRDAWFRETYLKNKRVLFIVPCAETANFHETVRNFSGYLERWNPKAIEEKIISNRLGAPFFRLVRLDMKDSSP